MSQVALFIVDGQLYDRYSLGLFDLETIPRVGELVYFDDENIKGEGIYKVKNVIHKVEPKRPTAIFMVSIEDDV